VVFIPGALAWNSASQGVENTGFFQLDGNTSPTACVSNDPTQNDWAGLFNAGGTKPCGAAGFSFVADNVGSSDATYWSGGGSKDAYDPATGPWNWGANNVSPDKNDLDNAFAAIYNVPDSNPLSTANPAPILFFGSDRFDTGGDAQQGFQFLQQRTCLGGGSSTLPGNAACPSSVGTTVPATCDSHAGQSNVGLFIDPSTGCPVHHKDGDLLVLVNFNKGGTLGSAAVFSWGPASGSPSPGSTDAGGHYTQVAFGSGTNAADCTSITGQSSFCATSNLTSLNEPVWTYSAKNSKGNVITNYLPGAFIEGGVNLASITGAGTCFPTFLAESRSSAGPGTGLGLTAQLKDLALGQFELCGASITIGQSAVNEVSHSHTFTVQVNGTQGGVSGPISGVHPTVTLTGSSGISGSYTGTGTVPGDFTDIHVTSDSCRTTGTDSNGQCTVVFTSSKAGIVTGHASASVVLSGGTTFNVATDGNAPNSGDAVKRFVDAKITLSPLTGTNEVSHAHTLTATVQQNDGLASGATGGDSATGFGPAPNGTVVTFSLLNKNPSTMNVSFVGGVNTCTITNGLGTCTVQINSPDAGTVDIHATTTFSVGGVSLTRATGDGLSGDSANANKVYVNGYIEIGPAEAFNLVNQPHTFTVTVHQDDGLASGATGGDSSNGFGPPPTGTLVNVTLTGSSGISGSYSGTGTLPGDFGDIHVTSDSCRSTGTDSNGQCTVVFTSAVAGTVTGHAAVDLTFGSVTVHRETDGNSPNSGNAIKHFVTGSITWYKVDNGGNPLGGATFTVCKTKNYNFSTQALDSITPVCTDVTDNQSPDASSTVGTFKLVGLSLGEYTVTEKTAPAGFVADSTVQTVDLLPASAGPPATSPDQTITQPFVNPRPILKISGFGYTNVATDANPAAGSGIVNGQSTYSVNLHNYGGADALLSGSSLVFSVSNLPSGGSLTCDGSAVTNSTSVTVSITGTVSAGGNMPQLQKICTYSHAAGAVISANLTVKYKANSTDPTARNASGSPANISFTVQGD
jgi:hypothetical protein